MINKLDLIDAYRTLQPGTAEKNTFLTAYGIFSKIEHMLSQMTSLNKFQRTRNHSVTFSDHSGFKLEISNEKIARKSKIWKIMPY